MNGEKERKIPSVVLYVKGIYGIKNQRIKKMEKELMLEAFIYALKQHTKCRALTPINPITDGCTVVIVDEEDGQSSIFKIDIRKIPTKEVAVIPDFLNEFLQMLPINKKPRFKF